MIAARWASISSKGGRPDNQDDRGEVESDGARAFVVADGLGGHAAGARASAEAVRAILATFGRAPSVEPELLNRQFSAAEAAIHAAQREDPAAAGCRTTAVVLVERDGHARWGHVGDTRLYHFRRGRLAGQTLDHSVPQALVQAGEIALADIRSHPDRNRLLRALGGEEGASPTLGEPFEVERGDAFLLCTDGFWEWITETDMEAALEGAEDPAAWLAAMERTLLQRASGPYDNYTATAVWFGGPSVEPAGEDAPGSGRGLAWALVLLVAAVGAGFWLLAVLR